MSARGIGYTSVRHARRVRAQSARTCQSPGTIRVSRQSRGSGSTRVLESSSMMRMAAISDEVVGPGSEGECCDLAAIPSQRRIRPNTHCGVGAAPARGAQARTHHHHLQRVGRTHDHVLHAAGAAADRGGVSRRSRAGWPDPPGSDIRAGVRLAGCGAHRRHLWDTPHDADLRVAPHGAQRSGAAGTGEPAQRRASISVAA